MRTPSIVLLAVALAACSDGGDDAARRRLFAGEGPGAAAAAPLDAGGPREALAASADAVAARLGSFEWTAAVEWTVERRGDEAQRVRAVERHRLRQLASGEFELETEIDPGLGPGSGTGRQVVWTGGMTYARALPAPFRERPTDRGRDARRFRDESFGLAAGMAALFGDALAIEPVGEATALGRRARSHRLALAEGAAGTPAAPAGPFPGGTPDPDTARRLAFLDGRVPVRAEGELLADAETGAPLRVRLAGAFGVKDAPDVRVSVELLAQVRALGAGVGTVNPPKGALPDARKPPGVAGALEAAGLRKPAGEPGGRAAPEDDDPAD